MSEHRKTHIYPDYTMTSDFEADYFTVIFQDKVVAYRNSLQILETRLNDISGAVYIKDTLYYSLKYDNKIYSLCNHCNDCIAEISNFSTIKIWKYISCSHKWIVIEVTQDNVDLSNSYYSIKDETMNLVYDLENSEILFELPMPYLIDMGIPEENNGVLLGEGCEGEIYLEGGDGSDEIFLSSIKFDLSIGKVDIQDSLHIISIYDNFEDILHTRVRAINNMCFPLFDKFLYKWLETKSLSAYAKYVVYYSDDIKGIIISQYQDGIVYRIFRLPIPHTRYTQYYFNEETNVFTIMDNGKIEQYIITLRSSTIIEKLNAYYTSHDDLQHDGDFINLLYSAISATKCERIREMKYNYDVALSFAGENRTYVEKIFTLLKIRQVRVFYDNEKRSELWGEDLPTKLDEIYRTDTKFCIVFCSEYYPKKKWAVLESKSYKVAQMETGRYDYILPVLLDDTEVPGILKTQGHLDARKLSPEEIVDAFITKLEDFDKKGY